MNSIIEEIRKELKASADEKTLESGRRFFKEEVKFYGVKTSEVNKIGKKYFPEIKNESKEAVFALCEELWKSGYNEEAFIACQWSYNFCKNYQPEDFRIFENWVKNYVSNWAACDTLCNHTVGDFLQIYPQFMPELKKWAVSSNRWVRRAAAVSLIVPARKGKFLNEILEIATILLTDKEDMVQKGYGWMLKASSEANLQPIFDFVMQNKSVMPRTALRYAIEKMPKTMKEEAMKK